MCRDRLERGTVIRFYPIHKGLSIVQPEKKGFGLWLWSRFIIFGQSLTVLTMPFYNIKEKFERIDGLVRRRATGTPDELAETLGICWATWFIWLEQLRSFGLPIAYNDHAQTYYYAQAGHAQFFHWQPTPAEADAQKYFGENEPV
jgi:hypothetical protein